ncbi:entericidin A/B family lipoprotein [Moraxella sp. Tifton1]|uniref:Entericidin A/B family lipoprotein n=1 Tax=Moraxella oculi TaxID=2940516 RepID=A0ABW8U7V2_9GAMM|nr:entericidin A/B family lipoprotein [Moraxella sp. Tifton1]MCL1623928.1 entericidin A/B family lipoprotein [Moraxella sp. Tifton1]
MKKLLIAATAVAFVLTGCNTIKGFGKDVSKAGDAVTDSAKKVEKKIKQ